jgi:hypothetical protein
MKMDRTEETELILRATEKVLRRIIRFLVGKLNFTMLNSLIRQIFIEESEKYLRKEKPGRHVPLAQLALITGLDTRVLSKIKADPEYGHPLAFCSTDASNMTLEANLIDVWLSDPRFYDKKAEQPLELDIWGGDSSFEQLFHESISARGITVQSVLQRLSSNDSISIDEKRQTVQLTASFWEPFKYGDAVAAFEVGFNAVGTMIDTVIHNYGAVKEGTPTFYQRSFWVNRLDKEEVEEFRKMVKEVLVGARDDSIKVMRQFEKRHPTKQQIIAGVGFHYFEEVNE